MSSGLIGALTGAFGFATTFSVTLERIVSYAGGVTVSQPTAVPLTRAFFEADIEVDMAAAGPGGRFTVTLHGVTPALYDLLRPQETVLHIALGYADGGQAEVMAGLLTERRLEAGEHFYAAVCSGVDYTFDRLQRAGAPVRTTYRQATAGAIAAALCARAGVATQITAPGPTLASQAFGDVSPLAALRQVAALAGWGLQTKDGKLWLGDPSTLGLTRLQPLDAADSAPVLASGAAPAALAARDFEVAGVPDLRPGDLVQLGPDTLRIESVHHVLTRDGGYRCTGRAVAPDAGPADLATAGRPSPARVAAQLQAHIAGRERTRPAASAADVSAYSPGAHTATLAAGLDPRPDMVSPSVQAPARPDTVPLPDKPLASPFAFRNCGLMVPVYPHMRALVVHPWHAPDDAVAAGFVWTDPEMPPPANEAGDWWLCLPTATDADGWPTGKGCDDLTTAGGQRVIAVKGLRITIGAGLLNPVGTRPSPGDDESLTIETAQGARVTVQGAQIQLTDGAVTLTVGNGRVSIG